MPIDIKSGLFSRCYTAVNSRVNDFPYLDKASVQLATYQVAGIVINRPEILKMLSRDDENEIGLFQMDGSRSNEGGNRACLGNLLELN